MRSVQGVLFGFGIGCLLACGGGGSFEAPLAALEGGGGSPRAEAMCAHLTKVRSLDTPCETVAAGEAFEIDGLEVQVSKASLWSGVVGAGASTERSRVKKVGGELLALEVDYKNLQPVRADVKLFAWVSDGAGEKAEPQPGNAREYSKGHEGWMDIYTFDLAVKPGETRTQALLFAIPPEDVKGSLWIVTRNEKRPDPTDPRGRKKLFTKEVFVVDLGPPT